jgi:hypothetical protein
MGFWNEGVYGGDAPLEWRENIYALCGVEEYGSDSKLLPIGSEIIENRINDLTSMIDEASTEKDDKNIGYQVLGAIIMHSGFNLDGNSKIRERIIEAAEDDEWSISNGLRKKILSNFKKIVKEYAYEAIDIETVNLIQDGDDSVDSDIAQEFQEMYSIMNGRIKKLTSNISETSGNKDYDDGYALAANEEIDFLNDFKELMVKQEMMGVLLDKIANGPVASESKVSEVQEWSPQASNSSGDLQYKKGKNTTTGGSFKSVRGSNGSDEMPG